MRIAILSDIHGNLPALEAVLADVKTRGADKVVNLGDSLSGPLLPRETAEFLMGQPWVHIAGNHERQLLTAEPESLGPSDSYALSCLTPEILTWMAGQPAQHALEGNILLCHGSPRRDTEYFLETVSPDGNVRPADEVELETRCARADAHVLLCGHSHLPRLGRTKTGRLVINPGSVGLQAYQDDGPPAHIIENGTPHARYALLEEKNGEWRTLFLAIPYDWERMAALARLRGRLDWEQGLRDGRLSCRTGIACDRPGPGPEARGTC